MIILSECGLFWVGGDGRVIILGGWGWVGKYFGWVGVGTLLDNAHFIGN